MLNFIIKRKKNNTKKIDIENTNYFTFSYSVGNFICMHLIFIH